MATNEWQWLVYKGGHGETIFCLTNPGISRDLIQPADEIAGLSPSKAVDRLRLMAEFGRVNYSESRKTIYAYPAMSELEYAGTGDVR